MVEITEVSETTESAGSGVEKAQACRAEGNACLGKGDFADACKKYEEGLLALAVLTSPDDRVPDLRLALHLNAALANLRRGNLASVVDHADGALAIDENNVKAIYRKALARKTLSEHPGHESNAQLAMQDFEKVVKLDPNNADARKQLQSLRASLKAQRIEVAKSQREAYKNTFKNVFASDKPLYEDAPAAEIVGPIVHAGFDDGEAAAPLVSAQDVSFYYQSSMPVLEGVSLSLRPGRCVGLFGNNSTGKTTLARLLTGQLSPVSGAVTHHGKERPSLLSSTVPSVAVAGVVVAVVAACGDAARGHALWRKRLRYHPVVQLLPWWAPALLLALLGLAVACAVGYVLYRRKGQDARHATILCTSDSQDKEQVSEKDTIEKVIGEKLPASMGAEERRDKVIAMLTAASFQMYNQETQEPVGNPKEYIRDGLLYGHLSGGQKHLIYILRCFAMRPRVLVCDELLGGLDSTRQPRVLHMLKRMGKDCGVAVLYITCELHQLRLVADSIGYTADNTIVELGPAMDVLEAPQHPKTREYLNQYRSLPGCSVLGGTLAKNHHAIADDPALAGPWLP